MSKCPCLTYLLPLHPKPITKQNYATPTIRKETLSNFIINPIHVLCRPFCVGTVFSLSGSKSERK